MGWQTTSNSRLVHVADDNMYVYDKKLDNEVLFQSQLLLHTDYLHLQINEQNVLR